MLTGTAEILLYFIVIVIIVVLSNIFYMLACNKEFSFKGKAKRW